MSSTLHFQWTFSLGRRRNHARPGKRKFSCPRRESRSRPSEYVLTTEPTRALALVKSEFYYTSRVYYTSVLGAECTALLCSVSRVASSSFSEVIFNDALVSSILTLPVNIFTWKKEKPCSPGARKFSLPQASIVCIVLRASATLATLLPWRWFSH